MIYFDNAATSRKKPEAVYEAFNYYVREVGTSPGRGSYSMAIQASRMLFQTRKAVAQFFGTPDPNNVVFTKNSTEAINLFFRGFLRKGDHVLITPFEHNAVLRPLHMMKEEGIIDYTVISEEAVYSPESSLSPYVKPNTRLFAATLASNLTGQVVFSPGLAAEVHRLGLSLFLDASQGAGKIRINMNEDGVDYLAFTGHKDLMALPGIGGFVSCDRVDLKPLIQGGTGIHGESYVNPEAFPDAYEAGTLNMPAIWSLKAAIEHLQNCFDEISKQENFLIEYLLLKMKQLPNVLVYRAEKTRVSTICFNISGIASSEVVRILDKASICVRGGIHCAILAHETLGTVETGAVRVSLNYMNTIEEIDCFIDVIKGIS